MLIEFWISRSQHLEEVVDEGLRDCQSAVICLLTLAGCKPAPDQGPLSPRAVEVAAIAAKPVRLSDEFNGRVASINSVDMRAFHVSKPRVLQFAEIARRKLDV